MSAERRVLVVEDDEAIAQAVSDQLRDAGFLVDVRHDGVAGFEAAMDNEYDAILLDIMLPKRNGFSVCMDLREAGNTTPLLMLTAKDGELDEIEGLEVGADDFLRKPFESAILLARVQALLRRHDQGRPPARHHWPRRHRQDEARSQGQRHGHFVDPPGIPTARLPHELPRSTRDQGRYPRGRLG